MKLYVVKKYVHAKSIHDAIRREKTAEIHEVYTEEKQVQELPPAMGFTIETDHDF